MELGGDHGVGDVVGRGGGGGGVVGHDVEVGVDGVEGVDGLAGGVLVGLRVVVSLEGGGVVEVVVKALVLLEGGGVVEVVVKALVLLEVGVRVAELGVWVVRAAVSSWCCGLCGGCCEEA